MPRIRSIKPEFWNSADTCSVSRDARLLWIALWNFADDSGRGNADPRQVKIQAFPGDNDIDVERTAELMLELYNAELGFDLYEVNGKPYYHIPPESWSHQKIDNPSKPKYPDPTDVFPKKFTEGSPRAPRAVGEGSPNDRGGLTEDSPRTPRTVGEGSPNDRGGTTEENSSSKSDTSKTLPEGSPRAPRAVGEGSPNGMGRIGKDRIGSRKGKDRIGSDQGREGARAREGLGKKGNSFNQEILGNIYDNEHRKAGKGPYTPKSKDKKTRQDATGDVLEIAKEKDLEPEKVARKSISNYFKHADKGLREKGFPLWGWAKAVSYFFDATDVNGPTEPIPKEDWKNEKDDTEKLDRLAAENAKK